MAYSNLQIKKKSYSKALKDFKEHNSEEGAPSFKTGYNRGFNDCLKWVLHIFDLQDVGNLKRLSTEVKIPLNHKFKGVTRQARKKLRKDCEIDGLERANIIERLIKKRGYNCERCGCKLQGKQNQPNTRQLHHKIKLTEGGTYKESNLELLCLKCHRMEHGHISSSNPTDTPKSQIKNHGQLSEDLRVRGKESQDGDNVAVDSPRFPAGTINKLGEKR